MDRFSKCALTFLGLWAFLCIAATTLVWATHTAEDEFEKNKRELLKAEGCLIIEECLKRG